MTFENGSSLVLELPVTMFDELPNAYVNVIFKQNGEAYANQLVELYIEGENVANLDTNADGFVRVDTYVLIQ